MDQSEKSHEKVPIEEALNRVGMRKLKTYIKAVDPQTVKLNCNNLVISCLISYLLITPGSVHSIDFPIIGTGFGLYSYMLTVVAGLGIISFACVGYGSTILVPASACELDTTVTQQGVLAAAPVVGSIIGATIWGYLADTRGRRKMVIVALIGGGLINCVASISVNWIMLMVFQFIASLSVSGIYTMVISLLSESVPMMNRNVVVLLVASISLLSQGLMAVFAIPVIPLSFSIEMPALGIFWNSWRTLVLIYSLPCFVTAICVFFCRESPKFVLTKGNPDQALEILRAIHRINHLGSKEEFDVIALQYEETPTTPADQTPEKQSQIVPLFKPPLVKYTLIMTTLFVFQQVGAFLVWLPTIANLFVEVYGTGAGESMTLCEIIRYEVDTVPDPDATPCALNVSALLIVLVVGALQSTINVLLSVIVNRTGRRNIVLVVTAVCGVCGILVNLIPNAIGSVVLFAVLLMGIVVLGLYVAIGVALFPTHLRAVAIALPLTGGRIGTFASIQILNLMLANNCEAGFYLFSSLFAASAIVASFLPDDRLFKPPAPVQRSEEKDLETNTDAISTTDSPKSERYRL